MSNTCRRWARKQALALFAVLAIACGGADSFLTGPSALRVKGATIRGQLDGQPGAASGDVAALSHTAGVRVSVVGTDLTTSTDGQGRFLLTGVPSGTVVLAFHGEGIEGQIELAGLSEQVEITITVHVSGGGVVLDGRTDHDDDSDSDGEDDSEVGFEGTVDSVGGDALVVDGRIVSVDASTRILRAGCEVALDDLQPGDLVEVDGVLQDDGSVLAKKIEVEVDVHEVSGNLESVDPLRVGGREFEVDDCTRIDGVPAVGARVEVKYIELADGTLLAVRVKVRQPQQGDDDDEDSDDDSDSED